MAPSTHVQKFGTWTFCSSHRGSCCSILQPADGLPIEMAKIHQQFTRFTTLSTVTVSRAAKSNLSDWR